MSTQRKLVLGLVVMTVAAGATVVATQGNAGSDSAKLSNPGRASIAIRGLTLPGAVIRRGDVLAVRDGRAVYRLERANAAPCFGVGPATDLGNVAAATCSRGGFPTAGQPVLDFSVYESTRHDVRDLSLYRVEGLAADGVAAVEFLRPNGTVALRVPVVANVYATSAVPNGAIAGFAAVDRAGKRLWRSP
jgi:hypothetical protein